MIIGNVHMPTTVNVVALILEVEKVGIKFPKLVLKSFSDF